MLIGYALAIVVGVLLALSFAVSRLIESVVYPQIVFLQIIPKIAIAPLFMIWFGYGLTSKVLVVFLLSFFPVVVSAVQAFRSRRPDILDLARDHGRGTPGACSGRCRCRTRSRLLFTGFKVAAALAATAAVVAEFVVVRSGPRLSAASTTRTASNTPGVFAAILVLSLMGLLLYADRRGASSASAIPWHVSQRVGRTELAGYRD